MNVIFDWDDRTEKLQNIHTGDERRSTTSHTYAAPGTYYPKIKIYNYLLDCSDQTLTLLPPLIVDYPLEGFFLVGPPISLLTHPDYATKTHFVAIEFQLCVLEGVNTPIYAKMEVEYGDKQSEIAKFLCKREDIGSKYNYCPSYPSNYVFCSFTPVHKYYITGNVMVKVRLWNAISSYYLEFGHLIYSQIKDVKNNLYLLPLGKEASRLPEEEMKTWESPYYPLGNTILFLSNMSYGTETKLTYWWDFGDNLHEVTSSSFARHKYREPGEYIISLNVSNPLSTESIDQVINYVFPTKVLLTYTGRIHIQRSISNICILIEKIIFFSCSH